MVHSFVDLNDNELRSGLKVVSEWDLTRLWTDVINAPAGDTITISTGDPIDVPNEEQLGEEVILAYSGDA